MQHVNISSIHALDFMFRQTPKNDGRWDDFQFYTNPPHDKADWLLIIDQPATDMTTDLPVSRRMVFLTEPLSIRQYDAAFLNQFAISFSMSPLPRFKGDCRLRHVALPWFYGVNMSAKGEPKITYDWGRLLAGSPQTEQTARLSAICSTKVLTSHQVKRLHFLKRLKAEMGDDLAMFGRGFVAIDDKVQGLEGFRYHLVLENNADPYGWTEKMADCILAGAYPIVAGNARLDLCFDPLGYTKIDLSSPCQAIQDVRNVLARDPASQADVQTALAINKKTLMMKEQFFPMSVVAMNEHDKPFKRLAIPVALAPPKKGLSARLKKRTRPLMKIATRIGLALEAQKHTPPPKVKT